MSFIGKVRHFIKDQGAYNDRFEEVASNYGMSPLPIKLDALLCRIVYGSPVPEYFSFEFYRLRGRERNTFITDVRTHHILTILNNASQEERDIIGEKPLFNKTFSDFIQREWLFAPDSSDEELRMFLQRHDELIVKPRNQNQGHGVYKLKSIEALEDFESFAKEAQEKELLFEEVIRQHPAMSEVNPDSVNTIRVATARDAQGEVHILGTSLRGGRAGSIVDNLHSGGAQYLVDKSTGIVSRGGVTFDGKKNILFHPSTGKKMIGFEVPNWDKVVSSVKAAAAIPKNLRYLGWDVAITEDGCELIEANIGQGCVGMQLDGVGKYRILKQYY